jgi:hypothetical protein
MPGNADGELARYLPERLDAPQEPCAAEAPEARLLNAGGIIYAFAGIEPSLTVDQLVKIGNLPNGDETFAETTEQPFEELFISSNAQLQRFVALDERGLPSMLRGSLPFGGQIYAPAEGATGTVDRATLTRIGCAGPFPAFSDLQASAPFARIYIAMSSAPEQLVTFEAVV